MGLDVSRPLSDVLITLAGGMTVYQRIWLTALAAGFVWVLSRAVAATGLRVAVRSVNQRGIWIYQDSERLTYSVTATVIAIPASVLVVLIWLVL